MTLSDREILELNKLCNSVVDGNIAESARVRLSNWLVESEAARQYYIRMMDLSASLGYYASEMQMDAADMPVRSRRFPQHGGWLWLALAASIVVVSAIWSGSPATTSSDAIDSPAATLSVEFEYVAKVTGVKATVWSGESAKSKLGTFLNRGARLELTQGFAELTFDSGAVVVLEGPAALDVNSAWDATLYRGALTVTVPIHAIGFRISNPAVEIVDLGTQFSMVADGEGTTSVLVFQGKVEAVPRSSRDKEVLFLRANESRRFAISGDFDVKMNQPIIAPFDMPVSFDRITKSINYVHWSFDEASGRVLGAKAVGLSPLTYDLTLKRKRAAAAPTEGFRNNGVRFDGRLLAKASFPGLSSNNPRTVAFWVKVPKDATLSEAYSMVAWRADSAKLGSRPVHIGWNRNPDEGPIGALRTDFSGGHALGMTTLRDGLWHYVTVVFVPGDDPDTPVQVKQYVDGKLESNRIIPGPKLSIAAKGNKNEDPSLADTLWLGCRLGSSGPKKARFRGKIDELVITDRSLDPAEIARLMDGHEIALPNP